MSGHRARFESSPSLNDKVISNLDSCRTAQDHSAMEVCDFGSNPGRLRMFRYVPTRMTLERSLIIALHGCGQTAADYAKGSGWLDLADRHGFAIVFPEQQFSPNRCFHWYGAGESSQNDYEIRSICQMIDGTVADHCIDPTRIYITGLSAGGAMASSLLAKHPNLFAAGAIVAGVPHGTASNLLQAFSSMLKARDKSPLEWGTIIRTSSSNDGPWPRVSVWHGSHDGVVDPSNAEASIHQWTNVHALNQTPTSDVTTNNHRVRTWLDSSGDVVVEAHTIEGMGHGVPLSIELENGYGRVGQFHFDVGVCSSSQIVKFFGLSGSPCEFAASDRRQLFNTTMTGRRRNPPLSPQESISFSEAL